MKKIINAKLYDTNAAQEIGDNWNGLPNNDFNYICETLYRKKTGEYFLHGAGGALTKYASSSGNNSWGDGEKIMPLTDDVAAEWAEIYLDADTYQRYFQVEPEELSKSKVTFYLSIDAQNRLKDASEKQNISRSEILDNLIFEHLK